MKLVKYDYSGFRNFIIGFYPFFLCVFGGLIMQVGATSESAVKLVSYLIAVMAWVFAIEIVKVQVEARTKSDVTGFLINALTSGQDTTIDINVNHIAKKITDE